MLSPETNATTNATAEAQMPGGRATKWVTKHDKFLLGAATATAGGVGSVVALAAASAIVPPSDGPDIVYHPGESVGHFDPEILTHAKENAVTILVMVFDADGNLIMNGHGSGFFIEGTDGRLIGTAAHVVDPSDINLPEGGEVQFFVRPDEGDLAGQLLPIKPPSGDAVDAVNDIGIVDLGQTTGYTGIGIAPPGSAELGEPLVTVGTSANQMFEGTVTHVMVSSLDGHRVDPDTGLFVEEESEDVIQLDGVVHGGNSGCQVIDSEGRLVAIITHGPNDLSGSNTTITFATKSEQLAELLERYRESPEFISDILQASSSSSSLSGAVDELAVDAAIQQWIEAKQAGFSPDDGGVSDIVPVMADPIDGGALKHFLVVGNQNSGFGPWSPDSPPDDGGVIDSLVEALDALA